KREAAAERAVGPLHPQVVVLVHFLLELAFTPDGEDVVLDADVEFFRLNLRNIRLDDEFVLGLVDVDRRRPGGQVGLVRSAIKSLVEEAIDVVLQGSSPAKRFKTT